MSAAARVALLLLLAALPVAAWADPISVVAFAVSATATAGIITATTAFFVNVGLSVLGASMARRKARKAAAAQRAAANASLQDRTVSVLRGNPPWQIVYGRAIVGGAIVDICASDKPNARKENGDTYTKADALKHLVIVLAAHECEAIHEVYIDGEPVGTLDGSGQPTGGAFYKASEADSRTVTFTTSITLPETPVAVLQAYSTTGDGIDAVHTSQTVTIGGNTLTGPAGIEVTCNYTVAAGGAMVRIGKHLGTSSQAVDSYLASVLPSRYTSAHQLKGLCYIVVTLDLEETRFQGGPPNITADVSGRKVLDTRTSTTAWSDNPALCIRDFLVAEWGYGAAAGEVDDTYLQAAADVCDELIDLDIGGTVTTDQPRYTLNGAVSTDSAAEATLEDMAGAMAGVVAYGGSWQVMAGTWTAPVMDLDDDDLHGMLEVVQADTPIDQLFNGVRGQYIPRGAQTPADINPYRNATFATADGRDLWLDLQLPFTDNLARARNLARTLMEGNRSGQVLRFPATLRAWPLQVGDRVRVTSAEYGLSLKTYRATDWQFGLDSAVLLTLQEDDASIYDLADAAVADPTPNTDLPNPWVVAAMAGVAATSGGTTLLRLADGTIVPRVQVTWTARTDAYVVQGGRIEVLWRRPGFDGWIAQSVAGSEAEAWLVGPNEDEPILIEVRAVNSLGVRGPSAYVAHTVVGKSAAPGNVAGLAYAIKPGQVVITWTNCPDVDYKATELRYGGTDWASATYLWRGAGSEYQQARPANGTYTVRACHIDTSGNYSVAPASISVVVDNSIDPSATKVVVIPIYRRSATSPALPSATPIYDFGTYLLSGLNNSWTTSVPAGTDPVWVSYATAAGTTSDTIAPAEWSAPQILAQDGSAGVTTAAVALYQRTTTSSAPSVVTTGTATYTFASGGITGQPSGWTPAVPSSGGGYLWVIRATAAAVGAADTIANTEWSAPVLLAQDGATGGTGATGSSARRAYALFTGNPASVAWDAGPTLTVSGDTLPGGTTVSSPDSATSWTSTTQTPTSGQAMFQADGLYSVTTNQTVWNAPYLSNLKVGNLSAIAADLGTITAGTITGATVRTAVAGARIELSGSSLKSTNASGSNLIEFDSTGKALFTGGVYDPNNGINYGAAVARIGTATNPSAIAGFYGWNERSVGGQAVRGESASANANAIGVLGVASNASSTGVFAQNQYGQALYALGQVDFDLRTTSDVELRLHGTTKHIRLKTEEPGFVTGYGVIVGNNDAEFSIGVTANNASEGAVATTPLAIALSTGVVRVTKLRVNQAAASSGANAATFSGLVPSGSAASTNLWGVIDYNGTEYYVPLWAK